MRIWLNIAPATPGAVWSYHCEERSDEAILWLRGQCHSSEIVFIGLAYCELETRPSFAISQPTLNPILTSGEAFASVVHPYSRRVGHPGQ